MEIPSHREHEESRTGDYEVSRRCLLNLLTAGNGKDVRRSICDDEARPFLSGDLCASR